MGLENINEMRKYRGMSIEELSETSGVPKGTLSKITAGITKNPSVDTVKSIVHAMGFTLDDLDSYPNIKRNVDLSVQEVQLVNKYRCLNDSGKDMVNMVLEKEYERSKHSNKNEEISEELFPSTDPQLTAEDERMIEQIKQEMLAEKRGRTSSVSTSAKDA